MGSGSSSNLTLSGSSFSGNACYENGGGAFVNNFTNATLGGDTFSGNLAGNESLDGSGGGAFLYGYGGGTLSISKTTFTGNNSYNAGGGAYIAYFTYVTLGTAPLGGDTFSGNQARRFRRRRLRQRLRRREPGHLQDQLQRQPILRRGRRGVPRRLHLHLRQLLQFHGQRDPG